jgi:hypothetical protein
MTFTQRQRHYLRWMVRLQYVSASQIAEAFFESVKTRSARMWAVRRDLGKLQERGIVGSFDAPPGKRGRPEKVYHVAKRAWKELLPVLGLDDWEGYTFSVPRSGMFVRHHLAINEFLLRLKKACDAKRLGFDFLAEFHMVKRGKKPEKYITINCRHPYNPGKRLLVTPDWVNTLANPAKGQAALLFGELDLGNEPLESSRRAESRTDVKTKLDAYREFMDEGAFGRFSKEFGRAFRGFRVLFATSRPESVLRLCGERNTGGLVWVADKDEVTAENVLGPIWSVPGLEGRQAILAGRRRRR